MSITRRTFLKGLLGITATAIIQPWKLFSRPTEKPLPHAPIEPAIWIQICEDCNGLPGKVLGWARPNKSFLPGIWMNARQRYWLVVPAQHTKLGQQFTPNVSGLTQRIDMSYYTPTTGWQGRHV